MLESGSWGHSVLQTPALVQVFVCILRINRVMGLIFTTLWTNSAANKLVMIISPNLQARGHIEFSPDHVDISMILSCLHNIL